MARETLRCTRQLDAPVQEVWSTLRTFSAPWHPMVQEMWAEQSGAVRAFRVAGEDGVYRERLTWYSDTDRLMAYTHLEGIAGAQRYDARLSVAEAATGGSVVTMSAEIEALAARVESIASGTRAIFEAGLAHLAAELPAPAGPDLTLPPCTLKDQSFDSLPQLGLTVTPDRAGPLCLFLHGIGGNRRNWDRQLAQTGHVLQSAALDLRGYGDSTLGSAQTTLEDYFSDIRRVMEVTGKDKVVLCGLSYGAWIATAFAEAHPDLTLGLVASGGCTGMSEAGPAERDAFRISREVPLDAGQSPADFAPAVMEVICGPEASVDVRQELTTSMSAIPAATYRDALRCFTNPPGRFDFSRFDLPVLLMTGEHDRLAPPAEIRSVASRIHECAAAPDVRFEVIEGAGHVCNVEQPTQYNAALLEFLRRFAP